MPVNSFQDYPMSWRPRRAELAAGPLYLALAARLEADILEGTLSVGTRLPPQRELADYLDLNFTTVTRAYDLCREKGLLQGVVGRGTFVTLPTGRSLETVADCAVVQSFPGVGASHVVSAAQRVLSRESAGRLFSYADRDGCPADRAAGLRWLSRCGVETSRENLLIFPGVQSALSTALLSLFRVGDVLAVDRFTYANLIHLARLSHIRLLAVPGDAGGMRPDALAEAIRCERRLKGVFLMPACANPTTLTLAEGRKDELADVIRRSGLVVLEDDASLAVPHRGERTLFSRVPESAVYLAGSVRCLAPGLRVTYVAAASSVTERLREGLHHLSIKASALEASVLTELVTTGAAETILAEKRRRAAEANRLFDRIFGRDCGPSTRPFRTLALRGTAGAGVEVERRLHELGVAVCHSDRFAVKGGEEESFLRVSISSVSRQADLERALLRIRDFISS